MRDTTTMLRADLVVGGLWEGSWFERGGQRGIVLRVHPSGHSYQTTLSGGTWIPAEGMWLVLDGPLGLGLGLAGLAARVAQRLAYNWHNTAMHGAIEVVDGWCAQSGRASDSVEEGLVDASTYLALTDRLCAAVGLTLAPGEVARWEREPQGWAVVTQGGRVSFHPSIDWNADVYAVPALTDIDVDDWQAALEAAIAEVTS